MQIKTWMLMLLASFVQVYERPVLFIIGDSTVKNGGAPQWGWGSFLGEHFDSAQIKVENHAIGGRSSRTFITEGRWERILAVLKPGDYVIIQFGHNDGGALDDTSRARGSIKGIGEESKEIYNPIRKQQEVVYTYGAYLRKYVADAKAKGAIPIICSPVPRDNWKEGKVNRANNDYGKWAKEVATATGTFYIDLNNAIADKYDEMGAEKVKPFFVGDHTHTSRDGALLNAITVVEGIRKLPDANLNKMIVN